MDLYSTKNGYFSNTYFGLGKYRDERRRRPVEVEESFAALASPAAKGIQVSR
jgi:hypothetical protein